MVCEDLASDCVHPSRPESRGAGGVFGGEGGIRTHGTFWVQRFSRPPDSTTLAPLRAVQWSLRQPLILAQLPLLPSGAEELLQDLAALVAEDAFDRLEPVVEGQGVRVEDRADGASLRVGDPVDDGRDPGVHAQMCRNVVLGIAFIIFLTTMKLCAIAGAFYDVV